MCSCKTQKTAQKVDSSNKENVNTEFIRYQSLSDTLNLLRIEIDKSKLKIIETINITEYDAESGKPTKETNAKREITQDFDQVAKQEGSQIVTECNDLEAEHFRDITQKMGYEVKEESEGGEYAFGKWLAIGISCLIGFVLVYLWLRQSTVRL